MGRVRDLFYKLSHELHLIIHMSCIWRCVYFHMPLSIFSCGHAVRLSVSHDFVCRHVRFDAIQTQAALHIVLTCNRHTF